jgi:PEP-CTERM motif
MKKLLALCFLAAAVAASSSADTITVMCPISGGSGTASTATATCNSASPPIGFTSLDSVVLTFKFDANFGLGSGSVLEAFDVVPTGGGDAFGGILDHPTNQLVTDVARGIVGTFTILNPTLAEVNAALGGLAIQDSWSGGSGSFNNTAFDYEIDVNYTPGDTSPTPEPGTFGLVGVGMLGLGLLARRRPQLRFN